MVQAGFVPQTSCHYKEVLPLFHSRLGYGQNITQLKHVQKIECLNENLEMDE